MFGLQAGEFLFHFLSKIYLRNMGTEDMYTATTYMQIWRAYLFLVSLTTDSSDRLLGSTVDGRK